MLRPVLSRGFASSTAAGEARAARQALAGAPCRPEAPAAGTRGLARAVRLSGADWIPTIQGLNLHEIQK